LELLIPHDHKKMDANLLACEIEYYMCCCHVVFNPSVTFSHNWLGHRLRERKSERGGNVIIAMGISPIIASCNCHCDCCIADISKLSIP